jgi:hypothetical protein
MKEWIKIILFFTAAIIVIGFLQNLNTEKPHEIIINGKKYIRSKEYVGNGVYQVILLSADSIK